jgi:hypothetical protein
MRRDRALHLSLRYHSEVWCSRLVRPAAVLLLAVVSAAPVVAQTWVELRQDDIGYRVEMPGKWKTQVNDLKTDVGPVKLIMAIVDAGNRAYIAGHSTYPEEAVRARPVAAVLDNARDGAAANVKGKVRTERPVTIGNLEGREVIIDAPNSAIVMVRYMLLKNTLVQALIAATKDAEKDPATTRFLESLKVLEAR